MNDTKYLITGGAGYPGFKLAKKIVENGSEVVLFDIHPPFGMLPLMHFIQGDISIYSNIFTSLKGINCVFHMASYGMSGREQLNKEKIFQVNIKGTQNIIKACLEQGIETLIYTSTYNVVFGGKEIINGNESLPYFPLNNHPDEYSRTKSIAEQLVLESNGYFIENKQSAKNEINKPKILRTCALRLAGVYGPGEQRHLPRIVNYMEVGLFKFVYGSIDSKVDFLHVDNLVEAHLGACKALTNEKKYIAAGQSYFISDGKPINNFEFFRPLVEGLGYRFPTLRIPITLIYYFAFITEFVHRLLSPIYNFQPILTRTEVYKTGVTHYFSIAKATKDFGYIPTRQNDLTEAIQWFKKNKLEKASLRHPNRILDWIKHFILATLFIIVIMSFLPFVR